MVTVRVVTDSASDLPGDLAGELGIDIVPVYLSFSDRSYRDGVDISPDQVLEKLKDGQLPRMSQPSPGDFLEAYRSLGYDTSSGTPHKDVSILSIHVTSELSGTYNGAKLAAELVPDLDITAIDTQTGSMGSGFVAIEAARAARRGMSKEEVLERVQKVIEHSAYFLVVPDLNFLYRSGRLGKATAWLGHSLSLAPVICVRDGAVAPYRLVRGYQRALKALVSAALSWAGKGPVRAAVVHVQAQAEAGQVMRMAARALKLSESYVVHARCAVTGALGPKTVGLCVTRVV